MTTIDAPRGWRLGAPGGVPIHLSATWPILVIVIVVSFGPQVARAVPGLGALGAYVVAAVYAGLLMVSVLAHEGAHAAGARAMGARVGYIVIDGFGGHTTYEASRLTPARSALIAVVGPLANGALAGAGWFLLPLLPEGVPRLLGIAFVLTNGIVGAFNLVPGHPLDGGHLLDALVWQVTGRRDLGMVVSGWAGRLVVVGLVGWLVVAPLLAGDRPSFLILAWTGLIGAMLWSGASQAVRTGRDMGAYHRIDLPSVMSPVLVVHEQDSLDVVARRVEETRSRTGLTPVVLVESDEGVGLLAGVDEGTPAGTPAGRFTDPLPPGWSVDVDTMPSVAAIVDHMHARSVSMVVLRRGAEPVGAVTASAVRAALTRAGAAS